MLTATGIVGKNMYPELPPLGGKYGRGYVGYGHWKSRGAYEKGAALYQNSPVKTA